MALTISRATGQSSAATGVRSLSGPCVAGDLLVVAAAVNSTGSPAMAVSDDVDGSNGWVLLESVTGISFNHARLWAKTATGGETQAVVTSMGSIGALTTWRIEGDSPSIVESSQSATSVGVLSIVAAGLTDAGEHVEHWVRGSNSLGTITWTGATTEGGGGWHSFASDTDGAASASWGSSRRAAVFSFSVSEVVATTPTGSATGSASFTAAVTGRPAASGSASSTATFSGSATADLSATGSAASSASFTASAAGAAVGASEALSGARFRARTASGTPAAPPNALTAFPGDAGFSTNNVGIHPESGTAWAAVDVGGTTRGQLYAVGSAASSATFSGSATSRPIAVGSAASSATFTGAATPAGDAATGSASSSATFTGIADGSAVEPATGTASSSAAFTAAVDGRPVAVGSASGSFTSTSAATGSGLGPATGSASSTAVFSAVVTGSGVGVATGTAASSATFAGTAAGVAVGVASSTATSTAAFTSTTTARPIAVGSAASSASFTTGAAGSHRLAAHWFYDHNLPRIFTDNAQPREFIG